MHIRQARPGTDIILKIERCTNILIKNNKYLNMIYTYMMRTHSQELTTTGRIGLGWVDVFKKVYQHFFLFSQCIFTLVCRRKYQWKEERKKVKDTQHYQPVLQPTSNHYNCITQEHIYPWLTHISFHCKFLKCVCVSMSVFDNVIL